jgi:hypothetical protein
MAPTIAREGRKEHGKKGAVPTNPELKLKKEIQSSTRRTNQPTNQQQPSEVK